MDLYKVSLKSYLASPEVYNDSLKSFSPKCLDNFLDCVTYESYLTISALPWSGGLSVDIILTFIKTLHLTNTSLGAILDSIYSYNQELNKLFSAFPEHSSPVVNHCSQFINFSHDYQLQSSIQSVADAWHCTWQRVLESPCSLVLQTLDFLSAKSSAEYFEHEFQMTKKS